MKWACRACSSAVIRLGAGKREDETVIQRRLAEARREIGQAKAGNVYDRFIVNDVLDHAIELAVGSVRDELSKRRGKRRATGA